MNKEELEKYCKLGYSSYKIAEITQLSQTNIRYWLNKFNLKKNIILKDLNNKKCGSCKLLKPISEFIKHSSRGENSYYSYCRACLNIQVKNRQVILKQKCVDYLGGKCIYCGYNRYIGALQFHHLNPKEKDFTISSKKLAKFEDLILELNKCILLCANCHVIRKFAIPNLSHISGICQIHYTVNNHFRICKPLL